MSNLPQELNKLNFSLITIRFHPTDMESFDFFYNTIFLTNFVYKCHVYCGTIEYDKTLDRHLHFVLGYTRNEWSDNDKLRTKLNSMKNYKHLAIKNTEFESCGIDCKTLNKYSPDSDEEDDEINKDNFIKSVAVMKSIGYCLKEDNKNYETNLSEKDLEAAYQAYIFSCKKHIGVLDNNLEYKILTVGNLLSYMYDSYKKSEMDIDDLPMLEAFMIQHHKLCFLKITDKQKTQALKELELHLTENPSEYKKYKTTTEEYLEQIEHIEEEFECHINSKTAMIKEIVYLRNKLKDKNI